MLTDLHIENIAVIERADIAFDGGLCVLTGETGAGKSIVIDSIDAVLGGRTGRELVRAGEDKALVTAVFDATPEAEAWCAENAAEPEDGQLLLSRRISAEGKSACRINGAPASVSQLRELGSLLLDLHGQNDGVKLLDESRHRVYLDGFGKTAPLLGEFAAARELYRADVKEASRLHMDEADKERLRESLSAKARELEKAELREGEEEELMSRRDLLRNSEKLTEALERAYAALCGGEPSAVELAADASANAARAAAYAAEAGKARAEIDEARALLEDAAELLRDFRGGLDFSPEEYDRIESRLALIKRLERKYSADEAGLIAQLADTRERLDELEFADDRLAALQKELERHERDAMSAAKRLSQARKKAATELEERIVSELRDLSMPSARFCVELTDVTAAPGFDSSGCDVVRFLMSANAGEEPGRISRIASGGELSRIMLAMKNVLAENDPAPTLIFDEVDSGVSGVAAQRVAEKLARLSRVRQVLCVTHLPQIAAMADTHFRIEKSERGGRTFTQVARLERSGRREELARLTVGEVVTPTALAGAEEQLSAAEKYRNNL